MWVCESRTLKADLRSAAARQERSRRCGRSQRKADCEHCSAGSDEPKPEIGAANAGSAGAAAAAIEISPPAIWSARPSRAAARLNPLLCSPARRRLSLCQVRLGEYPPPREFYPQGQQPAGTRRDAALPGYRLSACSALSSSPYRHSSMWRDFSQPSSEKNLHQDLRCWIRGSGRR